MEKIEISDKDNKILELIERIVTDGVDKEIKKGI